MRMHVTPEGGESYAGIASEWGGGWGTVFHVHPPTYLLGWCLPHGRRLHALHVLLHLHPFSGAKLHLQQQAVAGRGTTG